LINFDQKENMSFPERKRKIIETVYQSGNLSVLALARKLKISPATIRRDLHIIAEEGLLVRTHGGIMRPDEGPYSSFVKKQSANESVKQEIGRLAAGFVRDGDIIFMDCGSTVFTMCPHLKKMNRLTVITNSLPIVAELMDSPAVRINLIGGELDAARRAVHGQKALDHIAGYHADKAFVGVDGLSPGNGLTAVSEKEATITKAFAGNADAVFLLCDSSKIGKDAYLKFGPLSMIAHLLTDKGIRADLKKALIKKGLEVHITDHKKPGHE
jgi:DeoR family fructose operon transcriptional repressor